MLLHEPVNSAADHVVKVGLNLQKHADGNVSLEYRFESAKQGVVGSSRGHVQGTFAASVLKRPPSPDRDKPLNDIQRGITISGLV